MSFPIDPQKHHRPALLNPQDIVDYRRRLGRLPPVDFPPGWLFCLERGLPSKLRWRVPVRKVASMLGEVYLTRRTPRPAAVMTNFGGGSPITAELAEESIVLGARQLVLMTWGGSLQPELRPGDIVVCDQAIRDEGTSYHYLPPGKYVSGSAGLARRVASAIRRAGHPCTLGTTWTTDAPYRETPEEVRQYQQEGVQTVEMETAALFAIGQVRGVQTASVVVVMDCLGGLTWEVPERLDAIHRSLEVVYQASLAVLSEPQHDRS
jgi:uridine phosphorylase